MVDCFASTRWVCQFFKSISFVTSTPAAPDEHRLTRVAGGTGGSTIALPGKAWQILVLLVEAGGRLVPHDTFRTQIWPNIAVEDRTLTVHMSTLRKALGADDSGGYIETVVGVGYRLSVPVRTIAADDPLLQTGGAPPREAGLLAVRPFSTAGLAEADRYLGVALADALATTLNGLPGLTVSAGNAAEVSERNLNSSSPRHVLEGSVELQDNQLQVSARLVDAASGRAAWSERFARPQASGVDLQDAIAKRVAASLPQFADARYDPHSYRPRSTRAYFLQMQARASLKLLAPLPTMRAVSLFEQALALEPDYPAAQAGLASTYLQLCSTVLGRPLRLDEGMPLARQAAERALALDDKLAEAWAVLGRVKVEYDWDWDGTEADLAHAVALNAGSVEALTQYGMFLSAMGQHGEAIETMERARRLDPLRCQTLQNIGLVYWTSDRIDAALEVLNDSLEIKSDGPPLGHLLRMYIFDSLGNHEEAMVERRRWLTLEPHQKIFLAKVEETNRTGGARAATAIWAAMMENAGSYEGASNQWLAIGEAERALDCLERCVATRSTFLAFVGVAPPWRPLHGHKRFQKVLKTLKLEGRLA